MAHARGERLDERGLGASTINATVKILGQVLDDAVEDGYLTENPARGKRRRLKPRSRGGRGSSSTRSAR